MHLTERLRELGWEIESDEDLVAAASVQLGISQDAARLILCGVGDDVLTLPA